MKEKHQVSYVQYVISIICVLIIATTATYLFFDAQFQAYKEANPEVSPEIEKIQTLYSDIQTHYVGEIDDQALVDGALRGMTEALGDPYSSYVDGLSKEELQESISGNFIGIGVSLILSDNYPEIANAPISNTPAEKAGLRANDIILEVDDVSTEQKALTEIVQLIRGEKGTEVRLTIQRKEDVFQVKLTRDTIPIQTVTGELDPTDASIGRVKVSAFSENTASEFVTALRKLQKDGATAFVIDMRQNPGGLLDQVEKMASIFLKDGKTIVRFENKQGEQTKVVASSELDNGYKITDPVVVLVDDGSASAAEIFAAALKESAKRPVIGRKTFGKGTVQSIKNLTDASEVKLTVSKWLTPKGDWLHEKGLTPTIEADFPAYAYLPPLAKDHVMKVGETSDAVQNVHAMLEALDYSVDVKSLIFSEQTQEAVAQFQQANELPVTGEVDEQTAETIEKKIHEKIRANDLPYQKAVTELQKSKL